VRLIRAPRGGKVAAQNYAVPRTKGELVAFSDANTTWEPDALAQLVRPFADPDVAYVCGRLRLDAGDGSNREGIYWRYELWLREQESALGSITGGNGAIYAVRRGDYVDDDPRFGHDLGFPYVMVQNGRRSVYEPAAVAYEKPALDVEDEYGRKVRMFSQCWAHVLTNRMLRRRVPPLYLVELVSHRHLRYGSGVLHAALLASSAALASEGFPYGAALAGQLGFGALALAGRRRLPIPGAGLAYYYLLVTWATLVALRRYLQAGVPAMWEQAEGTR
jgi:hypothetical protein